MEKWRGKIAVVTGGSSGIGAAVAEKLYECGITVVALDLNPSENKNLNFYKCDVTDKESIKEAFKWIEEKFIFVHILINCAGIVRVGNILDTSDDTTKFIDDVIATNFSGVVHVARAAYELMKKSNDYGIIVNFSSIAGHVISYPNSIMVYPATKFAVRAFSETLRQELIRLGDEKVRVTNMSPGLVNTNIMKNSNAPQELDRSTNEKIPITLETEDIVDGILYLLSSPYRVNVTELTIRPIGDKY